MTRDSRALLPAKIRTRTEPKFGRADALMGFATSSEAVRTVLTRLPGSGCLASRHPCSRSSGGACSTAVAKSAGNSRRSRRTSSEAFHQGLPSGSPDGGSALPDKSDRK
jgi:hypothetical protein